MSEKKDSMFQFATPRRIYENTGLITLDEAKQMWRDNKAQFVKFLNDEAEPEMCIWVNCKDDSSYGETLWHVDRDAHIHGDRLYIEVMVGD